MNVFSHKSLVIFDWDGTLMDSIGLIVDAMHHAANANGLSVTSEATKGIIGIALVEAIAMLFPDHPDKHDAILADYANYYVQHCDKDELFDGIYDLINTLHREGKTLAVATGKKRIGLERVFEGSGIKPFFITSRCADETAGKPNPLMLEQILAETGHQVEHAVMVGDSIHDIRMANNMGMHSVAVSYGCEVAGVLVQENPTALADSVNELSCLLLS